MHIKTTTTKKVSKWVPDGAPVPGTITMHEHDKRVATSLQHEKLVEIDETIPGPPVEVGPGFTGLYRTFYGKPSAWMRNGCSSNPFPLYDTAVKVDSKFTQPGPKQTTAIVYVPPGVKVSDVIALYNALKPKTRSERVKDGAPKLVGESCTYASEGAGYTVVSKFEQRYKTEEKLILSGAHYLVGFIDACFGLAQWQRNAWGTPDPQNRPSTFATAIGAESDPLCTSNAAGNVKAPIYVPENIDSGDVLAAYTALRQYDGRAQITRRECALSGVAGERVPAPSEVSTMWRTYAPLSYPELKASRFRFPMEF